MKMNNNILYDYKRQRYEIIDIAGESEYDNDREVYLLAKDKDKNHYCILEYSDAFLATQKPLRSVFSRYVSDVMYDIESHSTRIADSDLEKWEKVKVDVLACNSLNAAERQNEQRKAEAIQAGLYPLDIADAHYAVSGDTLHLKFKENQEFTILEGDIDDSFKWKNLKEDDLAAYVEHWTLIYNNSGAALKDAQVGAACYILAAEELEQFIGQFSDKDKLSYALTENIVKNLDVSSAYDGFIGDKAYAIAEGCTAYMKANGVPFANSAGLLGDCSELKPELADVVQKYAVNNEVERPSAVKAEVEKLGNDFVHGKGIKELNAYSKHTNDYLATKYLVESKDIIIQAMKYKSSLTDTFNYDIVAKSGNVNLPFDSPVILGTCNEKMYGQLTGQAQGGVSAQPGVSAPLNFVPVAKPERSSKPQGKPGKQHQEQM